MSGVAASSSRRWVAMMSSSLAECSKEAGAYGLCLRAKVNELEKGVCEKEFAQFNACMKNAMKKGRR